MKPVDLKAKTAIANAWLEKGKADFHLDDLDSDLLAEHKRIIEASSQAGVREMKSLIFENVAVQAARNLGWDLKVLPPESSKSDPKFPGSGRKLQS